MIAFASLVLANSLAFAEIQASWPGLGFTTNGTLSGSTVEHPQSSSNILNITMETRDGGASVGTNLSRSFWFYGSGVGDLMVNIPYNITVICEGFAQVSARVGLFIGPGVTSTSQIQDEAHCTEGEVNKSGMLSASRSFNNPYWGPLVSIHLYGNANGVAITSEPSSLILFVIGFMALLLWTIRKEKRDLP